MIINISAEIMIMATILLMMLMIIIFMRMMLMIRIMRGVQYDDGMSMVIIVTATAILIMTTMNAFIKKEGE